ncbi:MAG: permease, partial [Oscillochloris sp.]|nr:permease [Oscillochloris sp.]
ELQLLFTRNLSSPWRLTNRYASIGAGLYFLGVFIYLLITAVIPITTTGAWRGIGDIIAVSFYLLGVVPLGGMALLELGIIGQASDVNGKLKLHAIFVAIFLVVAHVAMIFGMLSPSVLA